MSRKKKKKIIDLEIESSAFGGEGVARSEGFVYMVEGALPGDKVRALVRRKRKSYAQAKTLEILKPSPDRVVAPCRYFNSCGGCSFQNFTYEKQLFWKRRQVEDAFSRIGNFSDLKVEEVILSPCEFRYRNKMEFSFGASRWMTKEEIDSGEDVDNTFAFGLHAPGRFDKIVDIDECLIQSETADKILKIVKNLARELDVTLYDFIKREGFLKNLIIRRSVTEEKYMTILIASEPESDSERKFVRMYETELSKIIPEVSTIAFAANNGVSPASLEAPRILKGDGYLTEDISGVNFRISPFSFFQTNSFALNGFIEEIVSAAELEGEEIAWDLYCGAGSISLPAARKLKKIVGVELVESAVEDAEANAERNGIGNAEFYAADLHAKDNSELLNNFPKPDVIFIDPPRAGMHKNLIPLLKAAGAEKIVYVSCNPTTQARDCAELSDEYRIDYLRPVDMFPHTWHIENVARLTRI